MGAAALYVGIMSGTSLDAADAVLADFSSNRPRTLAFASVALPEALRARLAGLSDGSADSVDAAGKASLELADLYAQAVKQALAAAEVLPEAVTAIGCHGQTVRHRPVEGYTVQLNDPARLAELCAIDVVADFRRRDMAAGGQGAPLVPAFHEAVFRDPARARAVVNIGGIANITFLPPHGEVAGFDCGPGNVLLDAWAARNIHAPFDADGRWAQTGAVHRELLERLLSEPYLALPPPKSTGRELFRMRWLEERTIAGARAEDVQATLLELTALAIVDAIERFCAGTEEVFLAGGGARNAALVERIEALAAPRRVALTDALGVPTGQVEALAFAWLAMKLVKREPVDLSAATGARGPRLLGAIYPA